ncbi:hypothetical protein VNO78_08457 [Psophocarpus tetragonolobus]|uniref:Uncharacterized protein n=1 Tax=Psophocarpus tetragonolobus TaxID=3891 RepID=A0AAN9XT06_PSOTE
MLGRRGVGLARRLGLQVGIGRFGGWQHGVSLERRAILDNLSFLLRNENNKLEVIAKPLLPYPYGVWLSYVGVPCEASLVKVPCYGLETSKAYHTCVESNFALANG